jgi:adenylate cyclase
MSDVFISYARSDEEQAKRAELALSKSGYSVWRDAELPAHRSYAEVIEERLKSAHAVVVLWSAQAIKSQWVRAEADMARELGTLIQATLDGTLPPIPFNQIQCADLKEWSDDESNAGWRKLKGSVAALAGGSEELNGSAKPRDKRSICVLPFTNMSGDAEQEYFSDGISEDITTDLSKVSALAVTSRNTAFTLKGSAIDVPSLAKKLNVSHVLEGSVRKVGNRVRITAQLIDGASGDHVWAERYDRDLTDIFAIQDEISKAIVDALKVQLLPEEKKAIEHRGTMSADSYNLYLMARQYWVTGNYGDRRREERVIRLCRRAVELDPNYARAWALMALAQASLCFSFGASEDNGQTAADSALAIDPAIAEAYAVKARILSEQGLSEAANREIATALQLDPESWEVNREAASLSMAQMNISSAAHHYEKAVSLVEADYHSWAMLVTCYQAQGDRQGAARGAQMMVSKAEQVLAEDPSNGAALGICAGGHAILGRRELAMSTIERALLIDPENLNMRYNFACVLTEYLGETDAALDLLEEVLKGASARIVRVASRDPDLETLRDNPRFQSMLDGAQERLGITPAAP